jgi:hypothetical protein
MLWSTSMGYKGLDLVSWIVLRLIPVLTATAQCLLALLADLRGHSRKRSTMTLL